MSSGKASKDNTSLQSTRQMLDELDALMERMLALPVSDAEGPEEKGQAGPPTGKPHRPLPSKPERPGKSPVQRKPTVSATLTILEAPVSEQQPVNKKQARKQAAADAPGNDADGLPPPRHKPPTSRPAADPPKPPFLPPLEAIPEDAIPPSVLSLPMPDSVPPVQPLRWSRRRPMGNLALLPLVLINALFDHATMLLGWPGRLLRSRAGKNLLGIAGLALLAWAGFWLLKDWLGWTW